MHSVCRARHAGRFRQALIVLSSLAALGCGSGGSDGDGGSGGPGGGWAPLGQRFFTGNAANNYSVAATGGAVTVGYWDVALGKPCVKQFSASSGAWEYVGGGPVPLDGAGGDPLEYTTFKFRKAGERSVVGINRSLSDPDFTLYAANGSGAWERLPAIPLDLLPGYAAGRTTFPEQDFEFTVQGDTVFVVVNDDESTYPDERTCLSVFTFAGGAWALVPDRICHPKLSDSFAFEASYSNLTIEVSENRRIYLGYFKRESASSLTSVGLSVHDGTAWTTLADSSLAPVGTSSYSLHRFGISVFSEGAEDAVALAVGGPDNDARVFLNRGGAWSELPSPGVQAGVGTHLAVAHHGCADCISLAYKDCCTGLDGLSVKRHARGAWSVVGERNFTDFAASFYDDVLAADDDSLYLVFQTHNYEGRDTRGTLSVYRHSL